MAKDDTEVLKTIIAKSTNKAAVEVAQTELSSLKERKAALSAAIKPVLDVPQIVAKPSDVGGEGDGSTSKNIRSIKDDIKKISEETTKSRTILQAILNTNQKYFESNKELIDRLLTAKSLNDERLADLLKEFQKSSKGTGTDSDGPSGKKKDEGKDWGSLFGLLGNVGYGLLALLKGGKYLIDKVRGNTQLDEASKRTKISDDVKARSDAARRAKMDELERVRQEQKALAEKARLDETSKRAQAKADAEKKALAEQARAEEVKNAEAKKAAEDRAKARVQAEQKALSEQAANDNGSAALDEEQRRLKNRVVPRPGEARLAPSLEQIREQARLAREARMGGIDASTPKPDISVSRTGLRAAGYALDPVTQAATEGLEFVGARATGAVGAGARGAAYLVGGLPGAVLASLMMMTSTVARDEAELALDLYSKDPKKPSNQKMLRNNVLEHAKRNMELKEYAEFVRTISPYIVDPYNQAFLKKEIETLNKRATTYTATKAGGIKTKNFDPVEVPESYPATPSVSGFNMNFMDTIKEKKPEMTPEEAYRTLQGSQGSPSTRQPLPPTPRQKLTQEQISNIGNPTGAGPNNVVINKQGDTVNNIVNQNAGGGAAGASGSPSKIPSPFDHILYGETFNWGY